MEEAIDADYESIRDRVDEQRAAGWPAGWQKAVFGEEFPEWDPEGFAPDVTWPKVFEDIEEPPVERSTEPWYVAAQAQAQRTMPPYKEVERPKRRRVAPWVQAWEERRQELVRAHGEQEALAILAEQELQRLNDALGIEDEEEEEEEDGFEEYDAYGEHAYSQAEATVEEEDIVAEPAAGKEEEQVEEEKSTRKVLRRVAVGTPTYERQSSTVAIRQAVQC